MLDPYAVGQQHAADEGADTAHQRLKHVLYKCINFLLLTTPRDEPLSPSASAPGRTIVLGARFAMRPFCVRRPFISRQNRLACKGLCGAHSDPRDPLPLHFAGYVQLPLGLARYRRIRDAVLIDGPGMMARCRVATCCRAQGGVCRRLRRHGTTMRLRCRLVSPNARGFRTLRRAWPKTRLR